MMRSEAPAAMPMGCQRPVCPGTLHRRPRATTRFRGLRRIIILIFIHCFKMAVNVLYFRAIPHNSKCRFGGCGTASALPKCSIMSGCGTRIVLRGQKPLALCDRCPCFGSLLPPLAALTFAASSIICAFGLAAAAPRSPYRHLELCGIAFTMKKTIWKAFFAQCSVTLTTCITITG